MAVIAAVLMWSWCHCLPQTPAEWDSCRGSVEVGTTKPCTGKEGYENGRSLFFGFGRKKHHETR